MDEGLKYWGKHITVNHDEDEKPVTRLIWIGPLTEDELEIELESEDLSQFRHNVSDCLPPTDSKGSFVVAVESEDLYRIRDELLEAMNATVSYDENQMEMANKAIKTMRNKIERVLQRIQISTRDIIVYE